jgi:hypothetical protein
MKLICWLALGGLKQQFNCSGQNSASVHSYGYRNPHTYLKSTINLCLSVSKFVTILSICVNSLWKSG